MGRQAKKKSLRRAQAHQPLRFQLSDPGLARHFDIGASYHWPATEPPSHRRGKCVVSAIDYLRGIITFVAADPLPSGR